jgi:hypothetical protein
VAAKNKAVEDELEDEVAENSSGSDPPEAQKKPLSVFCAGGAEGEIAPSSRIYGKTDT